MGFETLFANLSSFKVFSVYTCTDYETLIWILEFLNIYLVNYIDSSRLLLLVKNSLFGDFGIILDSLINSSFVILI